MGRSLTTIISNLLFLCLLVAPAFCQTVEEYFNKGMEYDDNGMYDEAIAQYNKAIGLGAEDPSIYFNRGLAYARKRDHDRAILDFTRAIELYPEDPDSYYNRAIVYCAKQEYDKAWQDVNKAESLGMSPNPNFIKDLQRLSGREK